MSQTVDFSQIKEPSKEKLDALAEKIDKLWREALALNSEDGYRSRRLSLTVTALEEALMWSDRELKMWMPG